MRGFPEKLLLATDGSKDAALAARAAAHLAREAGSELHLAHVWRSVPSARFEDFIHTGLRNQAESLLAEATREVEEAGAEISEAHLREGSPADEILDLAVDLGAGLLVLGTRGRGPVERLLLGSVSEGVCRHATIPVLVVRGAWPPAGILVGDDASEDALNAGMLAARIGRLCGAQTTLLHADPRNDPRNDARTPPEAAYSPEEHAARIEAEIGERPATQTATGYPSEALVDAATPDTLLAVGGRGAGAAGRIRLGSTSNKVLKAAPGPVLLYPPNR